MNIAISVMTFLSLFVSVNEADENSPATAKSTADIIKAVERVALKDPDGKQYYSSIEFRGVHTKAFVVWYNPYSGRDACHVWVYSLDDKQEWTREAAEVVSDTPELSAEFDGNGVVTMRDFEGTAVRTYLKVPVAIAPETIQDKVSFKLGDESAIEFHRDGDQLTNPSKSKTAEIEKLSVKVQLAVTSASPFPPPREGATRPLLLVENNFDKTLHFRTLVRLKGSHEYFEMAEGIEPIPAEESINICWDFDSLVEEVVLYEFKLSDQPTE